MKPILIIYGSMSVGLLFEGLRLSGNPKKFLRAFFDGTSAPKNWAILLLIIVGLAVFLPMRIWPIFFFIGLLIGIVRTLSDRLLPQLNAGITLISTISFLYALSQIPQITDHPFLLLSVILPSIFTFVCAFTPLDLSRSVRFFLSIWNTAINAVFGIFIVCFIVGKSVSVDSVLTFRHQWDLFFFFLQYAMAGASLPSILYNACLFFGPITEKYLALDKSHLKRVKKITRERVDDYSPIQIRPSRAVLIVIIHAGPLVGNYLFHFQAPLFMVWYSLSISPLIVNFVLRLVSGEKNQPHYFSA